MTLFSPIIKTAITFFIVFSFLFFAFKIAFIIAIIRILNKTKKDIKHLMTVLNENLSRLNNCKHENCRNIEKEIKEFTEVKPSSKKDYTKEKRHQDFRRVK